MAPKAKPKANPGKENEKPAGRPTNCASCNKAFAQGDAMFAAPDAKEGEKKAVCKACAEASLPKCEACGKPAEGQVVKMGDKIYHVACLKCKLCTKQIEGKCTPLVKGQGFMCGSCAEDVHEKCKKAQELHEKGDMKGAAAIAKELVAKGMDLPPELLEEGQEAAPKGPQVSCFLCTKIIDGQYITMADDKTLCMPCKDDVQKKMSQAQELGKSGDIAGAQKIVKTLADKGLPMPKDLLEAPEALEESVTCKMCSKQIHGAYVMCGDAAVCEGCQGPMQDKMKSVPALANEGKLKEALSIIEDFKAKGIPLPEPMLKMAEQIAAAADASRMPCSMCSKDIDGKYMKCGDAVVCEKCHPSLQEKMKSIPALADEGKVEEALAVIKDLSSKGIPLPEDMVKIITTMANQKKVIDLFKSFDENDDGTITPDELTKALTKLGLSKPEIDVAFKEADANKDGMIDYDEFVAWVYAHPNKKIKDLVGDDVPSAPYEIRRTAST